MIPPYNHDLISLNYWLGIGVWALLFNGTLFLRCLFGADSHRINRCGGKVYGRPNQANGKFYHTATWLLVAKEKITSPNRL